MRHPIIPSVLLSALLLSGCASYTMAPSWTEADRKLVEATHFEASVGVADHENIWYSLGLLETLRATGLFDRVGLLSDLDTPDLIARVREPIEPAPLPSLLPNLTLGVIPGIASAEWGEVFSLHSAKKEGSTVNVDFRYEGSVHVGWMAMFTGMVPSRSYLPPTWYRSYARGLAVVICRNAAEIQALIDGKTVDGNP